MRRILIAFLLIQTTLLYGQEENTKEDVGSIATDRPVQSETPYTVPKKHLQFEMGAFYVEHNVSKTISVPDLLIKYGLTDRLELRLTNTYVLNTIRSGNPWNSQYTGPLIGAKYKIFYEESNGINMVTSLSTRANSLSSGDYDQPSETNLLGRVTVSKTFVGSWYGIVGLEYGYYADNDDQLFYVVQTGVSLAKNLTGVFELYGYSPTDHLPSATAINGALVYLITNEHQVDISAGYGLGGDNSPYDYYVAVGYSFRLGF